MGEGPHAVATLAGMNDLSKGGSEGRLCLTNLYHLLEVARCSFCGRSFEEKKLLSYRRRGRTE